jgi:hypothetical protein
MASTDSIILAERSNCCARTHSCGAALIHSERRLVQWPYDAPTEKVVLETRCSRLAEFPRSVNRLSFSPSFRNQAGLCTEVACNSQSGGPDVHLRRAVIARDGRELGSLHCATRSARRVLVVGLGDRVRCGWVVFYAPPADEEQQAHAGWESAMSYQLQRRLKNFAIYPDRVETVCPGSPRGYF